ncbi:ABC transporter ATP-binding protein [Halorussus amylolyticus]|uniref:ABC transporter ATP-binding protein n=1 Tax=Halorussus amylolyticus TaxID=1126242 RepID=UPI00104F991D|nr:ABC transporter ATP-binding protein [Halorussus amylolyticus]
MGVIETEGLTKRFGDVRAVEELDLTVEAGEVFGFLGPNGAGKSTTIDMLLDFVRPTAGTARVLGYDAQESPTEIHQRVGILPEGYGLYDRLSGRKHVEFMVDSKDASDDPGRILELVGLDGEDAERPVGGYSKGMAQRLVLGMALVGDPDLLILDEPSTGLDPNGAREVREIVRELADDGTTVFFSSHVLGQVEAVCDRVGIMQNGRLIAVDTIDGLRDSTGTGSSIELAVDSVPEGIETLVIEGVSSLTARDGTIRATCLEPEAKLAVIDRVRAEGATVRDIATSESSLEDLFTAYTTERGAESEEEVRA